MKALLLRIGIDKGTDGTLGPIFEDESFEFIPMSESDLHSKENRTYKNTIGRHGESFATYLPKRIENRILHDDPEFETSTYGDATAKRSYLLKLQNGDLLAFYAGLQPFNNDKFNTALYLIGYFTVEGVIDFNQLSKTDIETSYKLYSNNAHIKRSRPPTDLVIVVGNKRSSRLLSKAVPISQSKPDKSGKPTQAVSEEMERLLGISGFIQRSMPPRFITNPDKVDNLKKLLELY